MGIDVVIRADAATGITEELGFLGSGEERLAGTTYLPKDPPVGGIVMCPSICIDFVRGYRTEVVAARALAERGFAVQRFQYRGVGNSDGDEAAITFSTMVDDAREATAHLQERTGGKPIAVMGTRFGAVVAAAAAGGAGHPLVLFEPIADLARFFREGFRARMAHDLRDDPEGKQTAKKLVAVLERDGAVDLLGETIHLPLFQSASGQTLAGQLDGRPLPVLLVQLGKDGELHPTYEAAIDELGAKGLPVSVERVGDEQAWWFVDFEGQQERRLRQAQSNDDDPAALELASSLERWLAGVFTRTEPA